MISVCMATYNGERFIKNQIDSILSQLGADDELIISDDGSLDDTLKIIDSYNDSRIKVLHHQKNLENGMYKNFRYVTTNFENALMHAKGDYIFLSDQDDIWMPNKVARCVELLKNYDCVVHNYSIIDIDGKMIDEKHFTKNMIHRCLIANLLDNHFRGCCMVFRSCFLNQILPIPREIIAHDFWIGLIIAKRGKIIYELEPLIQSRWYEQSVSSKKKHGLFYKFFYRIFFLRELNKRMKML